MSDKERERENASQDGNEKQLLEQIRREASDEKASAERDAEQRVREITDRVEREKERIERDAYRRLDQELGTARDRELGKARMEARAELVRTKREIMDKVFERAGNELGEFRQGAKYEEVARRLIRETLEQFETEPEHSGTRVELEVSSNDEELAESIVSDEQVSVRVTGKETARGHFVARSGDGLRAVDNSFATRLDRAGRLRVEVVASTLFPDDDHDRNDGDSDSNERV